MSSTSRGGQRSPSDDYPTPSWCVDRLMEQPSIRDVLPIGNWLEPCGGSGGIIQTINRHLPGIRWSAVDIQEKYRTPLALLPDINYSIGDFLNSPIEDLLPEGPSQFDVIVTNPPFSLAEQFIEKSFQLSSWVVMLLRLNFAASARRQPFMSTFPPDIYVLPNRASFNGTGKTDSIDYAWFVWGPDRARRSGSFRVLELTSIDGRLAVG